MPTTREVEAARVERMRRRAEEQQPAPPSPTSAQGRRTARAEAAHAAATARNAWRCHVAECPIVGEWQPADSKEAAFAAADTHYLANHYTP